jgi:endonuclease/exonuclease/phosphatase family metal-dependent hydrolase
VAVVAPAVASTGWPTAARPASRLPFRGMPVRRQGRLARSQRSSFGRLRSCLAQGRKAPLDTGTRKIQDYLRTPTPINAPFDAVALRIQMSFLSINFYMTDIRPLKTRMVLLLEIIMLFSLVHTALGQGIKETPFNVITYNIRMNTPGDGVNAWPLRKDKVAALLKFHQADIFNVQEALPEQMDDLVSSFPDFDHVGAGRDDGKRAGEHMAIFFKKARFEKLEDGMFWLSETPSKPGLGWDALCNRTVTWIRLKDKITQRTFYVFDTHFDHRGEKAREESAKLILKTIKEINKENLPLILTGDLNLTKDSIPVQAIMKEFNDAQDKSRSLPYGPAGTSGGFEVKVMPRKIDFVFINEKIDILRHGVLSDSFGLYYPSDHLPVLVEVKVN